MTQSGSSNDRLVCRYCGLDSAVSHASGSECVDALQGERNRLTEHMRHGRPAPTDPAQPMSDRNAVSAVAPRVALSR